MELGGNGISTLLKQVVSFKGSVKYVIAAVSEFQGPADHPVETG